MKMLFLGFIIGVLICTIIVFIVDHYTGTDGVLKIDTSDANKDLYLFEVDDLEHLAEKKKIVIRVEKEEFEARD